jgi:hypothetical protein
LIKAGSVVPSSSHAHPLGRHANVLLSWRAHQMPGDVRVAIVRRVRPHQQGLGVTLARGLPADGHLRVPASKLAPGLNYFTLVATVHGVPFQELTFRGSAWRKPPSRKKAKRRPRTVHRRRR